MRSSGGPVSVASTWQTQKWSFLWVVSGEVGVKHWWRAFFSRVAQGFSMGSNVISTHNGLDQDSGAVSVYVHRAPGKSSRYVINYSQPAFNVVTVFLT